MHFNYYVRLSENVLLSTRYGHRSVLHPEKLCTFVYADWYVLNIPTERCIPHAFIGSISEQAFYNNYNELFHLLQFLAQPTEALFFACPHFILQLFLTAYLGSSLLILQQDIYHFLFTILKALTFFPEVKSPMVHALSSSVPGGWARDAGASNLPSHWHWVEEALSSLGLLSLFWSPSEHVALNE